MSPTVEKIGQMNIEGNVIPHTWFLSPLLRSESAVEGKEGKPNLVAIILLSDIVYWYRPVEIRDETSGRLLGTKQKFAADKLQKNYAKWGEQFGFTLRQVEDAMAFLKRAGLITVETRKVVMEYGTFPNCAFIEPVVDAVKAITFLSPGKTGDTSRKNGRSSPGKTGDPARNNGRSLPKKREHTKTPSETPTQITPESGASAGSSPSAVSEPALPPDASDLDRAWAFALAQIKGVVSPTSFNSYFRVSKPLTLDADAVVIAAPSRFAREWLEKNHRDNIASLMGEHLGRDIHIRFCLETEASK